MSSYFSLPSFARAKKNKEDLEKTNPQNPVLKDEDEKFLNKQIESEQAASKTKDAPPTIITESGKEQEISQEEHEHIATSPDQVAVPEKQPGAIDGAQDSKQEAAAQSSAHEPAAQDSKDETPTSEPKEESTAQESKDETPAPEVKEEATAEEAKGDVATEAQKDEPSAAESTEDPPEQAPENSAEKVEATVAKAKKSKKSTGFDLPSQEEAEAATRSFNVGAAETADKPQGEKKTWTSYLPSIGSKKDHKSGEKPAEASKEKTEEEPKEEPKAESKEGQKAETEEGESTESAQQRTWAQYASSAYSSLPSIPSIPASWKSKDKDSNAEPVYNEDGTINEEETKKKQEQEVSVLLDNLNMSSINNRVFAFSGETQKIYERFALVLKDTMEGGPTAYEDMEKLMKDAGPQLEKQFQSMPPFVQTLVKSLPSKLGTTLGPELMAAASEKPGNDMKARMAASNKSSASDGNPSIKIPDAGSKEEGGQQKKQKKRIPGLKGLVSEQGAVASILRNAVNFLRVRFPFLASTTNVVMSLAVFILMFVFWYCHKRGKEARLARETGTGKEGEAAAEDGDIEVEVTDEDEAEEEDEKGSAANKGEPESATKQEDSAEAVSAEAEKDAPGDVGAHESAAKQDDSAGAVSNKAEKDKDAVLDQSAPSEVPLPDQEKGEKGAHLEAEKAIGA